MDDSETRRRVPKHLRRRFPREAHGGQGPCLHHLAGQAFATHDAVIGRTVGFRAGAGVIQATGKAQFAVQIRRNEPALRVARICVQDRQPQVPQDGQRCQPKSSTAGRFHAITHPSIHCLCHSRRFALRYGSYLIPCAPAWPVPAEGSRARNPTANRSLRPDTFTTTGTGYANRPRMTSNMARIPMASPPLGRPGRSRVFQAITSKWIQGTSGSTNSLRNSAAVMAPP